ncbi:hypothetical protein LU293_00435 [Moraxella nasovis]|uniref:hypothetical protein n=1 Tax=Moraxella nasovis TaxID=2904121 RepID=UPI001F607774|nr:hypothetical protein [Moraxella nasovis]UNU73418.1 hypothetical protein LU293_00435 [Moraxella nasovis]
MIFKNAVSALSKASLRLALASLVAMLATTTNAKDALPSPKQSQPDQKAMEQITHFCTVYATGAAGIGAHKLNGVSQSDMLAEIDKSIATLKQDQGDQPAATLLQDAWHQIVPLIYDVPAIDTPKEQSEFIQEVGDFAMATCVQGLVEDLRRK